MKKGLTLFEEYDIRRVYDEKTETWYFSVVDIIRALLQQPDFLSSRKYWNKLKERLGKEGSESVTNCHRLKLETADGKKYLHAFVRMFHFADENYKQFECVKCISKAFMLLSNSPNAAYCGDIYA